MTPLQENAELGSNLDCQNHDILNIMHMHPVPPGLVDAKDPRLDGQLPVLIGSVTNASVSSTAGIEQSKLSLSGVIPPSWMDPGIFSGHYAAQGNLAELVSRKAANNGYAPLDADGKLPSVHVTPGAQPGTVNTVRISVPPEMKLMGTDTITTSGTLAVQWHAVGDLSWFGVNGTVGLDAVVRPAFSTGTLPIELIPPLDGTSFTSGTFSLDRLPVAVGMGIGHAPGILTDPGETGQANDYIGRDMKWHRFTGNKDYQPDLIKPNIVLASWTGGNAKVTIRCLSEGSFLFYRVTSGSPPVLPDFIQASVDHVTLNVLNLDYIEAYASKAGYNNSVISDYTVVTPFTTI